MFDKSEPVLQAVNLSATGMNSSITEEFRPEVDSEMNFLNYWAVLRKRFILILFCAVVSTIIGVVYTSKLPNVYMSGASIAIITPKKQSISTIQLDQSAYTSHINTQVAIIKSRNMASKVLSRIPDAVSLSFFGAKREEVSPGQLLETINVYNRDGRDILYITCEGKNPENTAYIANLYVDVFIEENEQQIQTSQDLVLNWLKKETPNLKQKIRQKRDMLIKLEQENPEIRTYSQEQGQVHSSMVNRLKHELQDINIKMINMELRHQKCQEVRKINSLNIILSLDLFFNDSIIKELRNQKFALDVKIRDLKTRYKPIHPEIKNAEEMIQQIEKQIFENSDLIITQIEQSYKDLQSTKNRLAQMLEDQEEQNLSFKQKYLMYEDLKNELDALQKTYFSFQDKMKELDSTKSYQFDIIRRIDRASVPGAPYKPNKTQNYLISCFLGFLIGIGFTFLLEILDQTVKTVEEVQKSVPARVLGFIPFISPKIFLGKTTHAVEEKENTNVAEAFRSISTSIFFAEEQTHKRTFVVTSSLAQDGKTTIFCNLALTIAKAGNKTLLIDCDLRRPRLRKLFDLQERDGFSEVLKGERKAQEVVQKINSNLYCICAGRIPKDPYECIHNSKLKSIIENLQNEYDYILIDAPPVGITTDAFLLGKKLNSLLFVVTVHRTPKRMLKQLMHRIQSLDIELSGVILNDVKGSYSSQLSYYNYYGHYYTKSYYVRKDEPKQIEQPSA